MTAGPTAISLVSRAAISDPNSSQPDVPAAVRLAGVSVSYGDQAAVSDVDLMVHAGETVALLGPSGSGKSTLLYAVAGLLGLSAGQIHLDGRLVSSVKASEPPERRSIGMVFQHYGLWPHLDALDTVAYPMRRAGLGADEARQQATELLTQMRISELAKRKPAELSGGEQQRVGLARALARRPDLYLLDEPTAHLDSVLKRELQAELASRIGTDGAAAIHATHDVEEALAIADRVVLLRDGSVVQVGRPADIYAHPADDWAARLTGPAAFVEGPVEGRPAGEMGPGRYLVRPDWVRFDGPLLATVLDVRYRGTHTDYRLLTSLGELLLRAMGMPNASVGSEVSCRIERVWRVPGHP